MKTKKQKDNLSNHSKILSFMIALFIFLIVNFLILFFSVVKTNYETKKIYSNNYCTNAKSVEIATDKKSYFSGEKINLTIKNNEKQSIYFEPCEYLNDFEKKINGAWQEENIVVNNNYNKFSFNKNKSATRCEIELPESGEGIYRSIVQIYYNCQMPGYDTCQNSKTFYSNEFEVTEKAMSNEEDFCVDEDISKCEGKKIAVIGLINEEEGVYVITDFYFYGREINNSVKYLKIANSSKIILSGAEEFTDSMVGYNPVYFVSGILKKPIEDCCGFVEYENYSTLFLEVENVSIYGDY